MFEFVVTDEFKKDLNDLDSVIQAAIKEKLRYIVTLGNPMQCARKLRGYKDLFRFRAGDYRMIFRLASKRIILFRVRHRKNVYEGY